MDLKKIELGERIESARFLGREFLVWLWWIAALADEDVPVDALPEGITIGFGEALTLERQAQGVERTAMRGLCPSAQIEARAALRDGKLPTAAKIWITKNEATWSFRLLADELTLAGLRLPQLLTEVEDDQAFERAQLLDDIEGIVDGLFGTFVGIRTSDAWAAQLDAIRAWIRGGA